MTTETYIATVRCDDDEELAARLERYKLVELEGQEAIGQLSQYEVHLVFHALDPQAAALTEADLLGSRLTIEVAPDRGGEVVMTRHGMVSEVKSRRLDDPDSGAVRHSLWLTIVPRLWRTTLVATQEVHLDQTLPQIVTAKLAGVGLEAAHRMHLLERYASRELVTQVAESDLAFLSRWLEREGIGYYFDHASGEDVVVFTDDNAGYGDGAAIAPGMRLAEEDLQLTRHDRLVPRFHGVDDYNYRTPRMSLLHMHELEAGYAGGVLDYGAHHKTPEEAQRQAELRAEACLPERRRLVCEGAHPGICAGHRYDLGLARGDSEEVLVIEATHRLTQSVGMVEGETSTRYETRFVAVPTDVAYRPPRRTPWPRMLGLRTGMVQPGPDGKTNGFALLDQEGRYTVQLHYDSLGADRTKASHPVRMAQTFAGPNQGMHFPLRPGTEVVIAYVNGDPDRPIIVGAVPNTETRSPVRAESANRNRITTASGVLMEISEGR